MKRKYIGDVTRESANSLGQGTVCANAHWALLEAYVTASCGQMGLDAFSDVYSVVLRRDAAAYLERGKVALAQFDLYGQNPTVGRLSCIRQAWSFLKKFPFDQSELAVDRQATALRKILEAEAKCRETNNRLRGQTRGELPSFIHRARFLIADVLGDCNDAIREIVFGAGRHGKGSTLSNKRKRVTEYYKYADFPYTCTASASKYALAAITSDPHWIRMLEGSGRLTATPMDVWPKGNTSRAQVEQLLFRACVDRVSSDKITFVPKDATTDRGIAFGGSLNLFLQLGVNEYMTSRLHDVHVYLRDQTRNQRFAYLGSRYCERDGEASPSQFSTIDLESASDTVSIEAVKLLLPPDWYAFLSDLRHVSGTVTGTDIDIIYEKFSAMGNGYTFPLESLIFWAVCKATREIMGLSCASDDIAVYGDDIIVRYETAPAVIDNLEYLGFKVNKEKTFLTGPFKESCGRDFYKGCDVRPLYLKRGLTDDSDFYYIANRVSRIAMDRGPTPGYTAIYSRCVALIPRNQIRFGALCDSSDSCLSVPIGTISRAGVRPWLSHEERRHLNRELRLNGLWCSDSNLPVQVTQIDCAKTFKGLRHICVYLWLRHHRGASAEDGDLLFRTFEDSLHFEAASRGQVTQRGCLERKWRAAVVPSWDNVLQPDHKICYHPAWYMERSF